MSEHKQNMKPQSIKQSVKLDATDRGALKYIRQKRDIADRYEIANVLGVSYPTLIRSLAKLTSEKYIDGKKLAISTERKSVFWGVSIGTSHVKICLIDLAFQLVDRGVFYKYFDISKAGESFQPKDLTTSEDETDSYQIAKKYLCYETPKTYDDFRVMLNWILESVLAFSHQEGTEFITSGVGIAFSGAVDKTNSILKKVISIKYLEDVSLKQVIAPDIYAALENLDIPLVFDHNAKAAAVAEKESAYNRSDVSARNMLCLYLGTGIGAGMILDNRLYTGAANFAGEISHFPIFFSSTSGNSIEAVFAEFRDSQEPPICTCGSINCLECYVRILDNYLSANSDQKKETAHDDVTVSKMQRAYKLLGQLIGYTITAMVNILNIDTVVCTGRLTKYYSSIERHIQDQMAKNGVSYTRNCCKVINSFHEKLAPSVGIAIESYYASIGESLDWNIVARA